MKTWYTAAQAAQILNRNAFTVREWCRDGRIRAIVAPHGNRFRWMISDDEIHRYFREGLFSRRRS